MRWWHLASSTMAHVIMLSFKQAYLAPGQRGWGILFMEAGDRRGWSEAGVNEALAESYHLERFWHAEVAAAAYTPADGSALPAPRLVHVKGVSVGVLGGKGQASESCKSQKGTSLKVRQSWRLEEPSKRCERIGGSTEKAPMDARFRGQTLLFPRKPQWWHVWFILSG